MMRRPPPRPGLGKKASSGFKITYSVTQLLDRGKDSVSKETGCPPLEGWEKYQYDKIGPLHQEDGNSRSAQAVTKEYLATLVMRPGSARDLHAEHLAALAAKQAQEPEHSSLGPRGGGTRGGMGWGDRDRDRDRERDRYGDRNKDRGLSRFDHDRDRRGDGGRRDRARDAHQPSGRPPSRWDALKPDRDRDRGYNNRSNRDSRDRDDGDELGGGGRQDARLVGGRDRDRDGRNARAADGLRDGGLAAHDRALANERAAAAGGGGRARDRDRLGGGGSGGGRYGGTSGGVNNDADIWDMPSSALPGGEGASKDPPRNSRAAGLKSAEREQREKDQKAEEVREFQAKKLMFEKELERERAAYKQQGPIKGAGAAPNGDATDFPDMGGGFLEGNDEDGSGDGNNHLLGGALEENTSATPIRDNGNEDGSATRFEGEKPERDGKQKSRDSFLDGFLGGGGREEGTRVGGVISTAGSEPRDGGSVAGAGSRADGTGGGGFPGGGFFSFMAPGNSISTIDKITEVTRGGAGKFFSVDSTATGVVPSRLSPWEKTENKTAKAAAAAAAPGSRGAGGGEGSMAALSAAEKSALLKRMIMGGGAGVPKRSDAPSPQQTDSHRPAADGFIGRERRSLWGNGSAPLEAARSQVVGSEGGVAVVGEKVEGGSPSGGQTRAGGASTAEVDMLMQKLAVARLPENQRREAFKQVQKQRELQQHYHQQQQHQQQHQPIGDGRSSPLSMSSQSPRNPLGSPPASVVGQPEPPAGPPPSLSLMGSSSPPLGGIAFRPGGKRPLAGGNEAESFTGPPGRLPTNNGQQPQLGVDFAVEEARRRQLQQQQLRQQQLQVIQQQRERERVDQYRQFQIQQQQKLDREHQRLEQQRQQDLRHRQEQLQHEQQQAALRHRQQQQQQRRYAGEATGVPLTPGSHVLQQQQQLLRQRQLRMHQQQQQQQMHIRQHPNAHQQHVPRASAISGVRAMQGGPVARSLLQQHQQQQQQHQQQRQLVGEVGVEGGSHLLSPAGGPIVMPQGQQRAGYPQAGHPVARQPQQQGVGYPGVTGGGHLQQRQQPPSSISPATMAHAGGGGGTNIMNTSAEFPSSTRTEDLLSVLGFQKTPADTGAGQAGYGGGGDLSASGSGGGHQFAFHEPQPGARRARAVNGMGGSMALDPRARARALAGGMGVGPGVGVGGRRMAGRPGGAPGQMTADEMDRMVTGN